MRSRRDEISLRKEAEGDRGGVSAAPVFVTDESRRSHVVEGVRPGFPATAADREDCRGTRSSGEPAETRRHAALSAILKREYPEGRSHWSGKGPGSEAQHLTGPNPATCSQ